MQFILPYQIVFYIFCFLTLLPQQSFSQDLEPRRWSPLPTGINIVGIGYARTDGKLFLDPLLDVEDAKVHFNTFVVSYVRPFRIGKKMARLDLVQPFSKARWEGRLRGEPAEVIRTGFADPRIRLSYNFIGAPAGGPAEMKEYFTANPVNTTVGISVAVTLPFGKYSEETLLNIGQHQLVVRPQIGVLHNRGNWSYELSGSVFLFGRNTEFFGNTTRKQDPLIALQSHLVRSFNKGLWASLSAGYGFGGESFVDEQPKMDERGIFLGSFSSGLRIAPKQSIKFSYIYSETLKAIGADTHTFVLGWSIIFK